MTGMSLTRKAIDRLPPWAQTLIMVFAVPILLSGLFHYGWTFLLKVIFSPEI